MHVCIYMSICYVGIAIYIIYYICLCTCVLVLFYAHMS